MQNTASKLFQKKTKCVYKGGTEDVVSTASTRHPIMVQLRPVTKNYLPQQIVCLISYLVPSVLVAFLVVNKRCVQSRTHLKLLKYAAVRIIKMARKILIVIKSFNLMLFFSLSLSLPYDRTKETSFQQTIFSTNKNRQFFKNQKDV